MVEESEIVIVVVVGTQLGMVGVERVVELWDRIRGRKQLKVERGWIEG